MSSNTDTVPMTPPPEEADSDSSCVATSHFVLELLQIDHPAVLRAGGIELIVGPTASTLPSSIKTILSSPSTVEMRWAISRVVFPARLFFRLSRMIFSVRVSTAETESSRIRMGASFSRARAMEMRCFWPPETVTPRSPRTVS